jgi:TnpA family transposase
LSDNRFGSVQLTSTLDMEDIENRMSIDTGEICQYDSNEYRRNISLNKNSFDNDRIPDSLLKSSDGNHEKKSTKELISRVATLFAIVLVRCLTNSSYCS